MRRHIFFRGLVGASLLLTALLGSSALHGEPDPVLYLDPSRSVEERVDDLLGRMTLEEKVGQMTQADHSFVKREEDITRYALGSILSGGDSEHKDITANGWADRHDDYQRRALATRLRIPILYGVDAVHGHNNVKGAVIFPHNIGLGATRDPALVEEVARVTAAEVAATGIRWTFAAGIAVARDERWGRTYESFGESAELAVTMGAASVRGFQGDDLGLPTSVLACAKHFVGDGGTSAGIDRGDTSVDERVLRKVHLPGYEAAIKEGVGSVMTSFSSVNGTKMHGHRDLVTGVLKREMGFSGLVVSDWAGIDELPGDYTSDVERAVNAGIDMVMVPGEYVKFYETLLAHARSGLVAPSRIDDAVRRILTIKFRLGLFERPFADRSRLSIVGSAKHREVARRAVRQSLVLLKNEKGTLPLSKSGRHIVVAGAAADDLGCQLGGWSISWQGKEGRFTDGTTVLAAIRKAVDKTATVTFSRRGRIPKGADAVVVVLAEKPYAEMQGDRRRLDLDKRDVDVVRRAHDSGIPTTVVLMSGRPLILEPILPHADALIAAWLPGSEGEGVADLLFGDSKPTGKLPHSWPASMDQIPVNADGLGPDTGAKPLFPYGFGLTY